MALSEPGGSRQPAAQVSVYAEMSTVGNAVGAPAAWRSARRLAGWLIVGYVAAIAAVCIALRYSAVVVRGNELTGDRAVFTSINAATLTGFQQTIGVREMYAVGSGGPVILLMLTIVGSFVSLVIGGLAVSKILRLSFTPAQIVTAAVTAIVLATIGGAAALASAGHSVFESIFQAASAFGNSGLWIGRVPASGSPYTFLVLLPLAVLGGLGLTVLMELTDRVFGGPPLSRHARVVLALTGIFYLCGMVALVLAQVPAAAGHGWAAWRSTLASCSTAAVNTRSAGIPFQTPAAFTAPGQWLLMALMLVGASSGGTAGGVKMNTFWHLIPGVGEVLRGRAPGRPVGIAAVWIALYALALFVGVLFMVGSEPQIPADRLLFLVVSALGNVGLSHDPIAIVGPGLFILSALMLAGRLAPLAILWWMAETTRGADVAVG